METLTKPNEVKPDETEHVWMDLSENLQHAVAIVHAKALKRKPEKILRLLNLGHPKIIFGPNQSYLRIHHESLDVMKLIFKNYL